MGTLKVGTKGSDESVSQRDEGTDKGHRLPAAGVAVEAEAVLGGVEGRRPSDRRPSVDEDVQVAALGPRQTWA